MMTKWLTTLPSPITTIPSTIILFLSAIILPDANPTLFFYDKLFVNQNHLRQKLQGKRIWITGASSGIGAELAKQLHSHGAKLILSSRSENDLKRVKFMEGNENIDMIQLLPLDVTSNDQEITNSVQKALQFYDGIDILILNAGIGQLRPALLEHADYGASNTRSLMEVNYIAPVRLAMELIQQDSWDRRQIHTNHNNNQSKGHIVVTSSIAGKMPLPMGSSYAASKHAIHGFFSSLRSEYNQWLRIDLPCPGPVATHFHTKIQSSESSQQSVQESDDGAKMSAERCARLIISSIIGPERLMQETWITIQPSLSFMFLNQYFPTLSNFLLGKIGPLRIKAWEAGLPLYKVSSWIKVMKNNDN